MNELIVLNDQEVAELVSFDENLRLIEQAFADYNRGESYVMPVIREKIKKHNGFFGIKSGYLENQEVLGFKAGGFWADNKDKGLPNHQSAMMLFDPATGQPTAVVAANFVTQIRTAAIGAIGCKYLARPESRVLALIGAGHQGRRRDRARVDHRVRASPGCRQHRVDRVERLPGGIHAKFVAGPLRTDVRADQGEGERLGDAHHGEAREGVSFIEDPAVAGHYA